MSVSRLRTGEEFLGRGRVARMRLAGGLHRHGVWQLPPSVREILRRRFVARDDERARNYDFARATALVDQELAANE